LLPDNFVFFTFLIYFDNPENASSKKKDINLISTSSKVFPFFLTLSMTPLEAAAAAPAATAAGQNV